MNPCTQPSPPPSYLPLPSRPQHEYRDAEAHLVKFLQLQSKALVLVKISTVEMLKTATAEVRDALAVCPYLLAEAYCAWAG